LLSIPDAATKIGLSAFEGCSSLKDLVIPASASDIGWRDVTGDRELVIPAGVETLSAGWFSGWPSLARVAIPEGVKVIGDGAFNCCSNLREVVIPATVTEIGSTPSTGVRS
jgi:hypothetical protein